MYQDCRNKIGVNGVVVWGKKVKMFRQVLTSSTQPLIWSIHVERTRTAKKCTKMQNARAGRAELLFLWASFSINLSRNIIALQVETLCCSYYRLRDQLVSQQNIVLQVEASCCEK